MESFYCWQKIDSLAPPCRAPVWAMMHNPIHERLLEADIPASLFRLEPLVAQDFLAFSAQFAIESRACEQIASFRSRAKSIGSSTQTHIQHFIDSKLPLQELAGAIPQIAPAL